MKSFKAYVIMNKANISKEKTTVNFPTSFNMRGLVRSIVLNAFIPYMLYILSKKYLSNSEFEALSIASLFPIFDSIVDFVRHRRFDLIAIITLLSIGASIIAIFFGGSPKLLLIRESFFTGALGTLCFISLLFPRPLMFFFGRQMVVGNDDAKIAQFNKKWEFPRVRFYFRLITMVWGFAFLGDFILRVIFVYSLPSSVVLLISPFISGAITIGTIMWTFAYARKSIIRGAEAGNK